jgi:hypothetical protein
MSPESSSPLEDRLQALLGSSDLDLPTRPGATGVVMGRVRRARRRRRVVKAAVPAVLTVAAAVGGMSIFFQHDEPSAPPSPTVLTAAGIGDLRLGMKVAEAQAAGAIGRLERLDTSVNCPQYRGIGAVEQVTVQDGVIVRISVSDRADSSEGVQIGDTYAQLQEVYGTRLSHPSDADPNVREVLAENGSTRYEFRLDATEARDITPETRVQFIDLSTTTNTCG